MTSRLFFIGFVAASLLASCTGRLTIEKRQYRDGFYISLSHRAAHTQAEKREDTLQVKSKEIPGMVGEVVPAPLPTSVVISDEAVLNTPGTDLPSNEILPGSHEDTLLEVNRQWSDRENVASPIVKDDPRIPKWLFWTALILLLAVLIIAPGFFYPWYFLIAVPGFVPFLMWFAALILSIVAVRISKKRRLNEANQERAYYYGQWEKRSRILAWIIGGIMLVCVAILALAILALSGLGG